VKASSIYAGTCHRIRTIKQKFVIVFFTRYFDQGFIIGILSSARRHSDAFILFDRFATWSMRRLNAQSHQNS